MRVAKELTFERQCATRGVHVALATSSVNVPSEYASVAAGDFTPWVQSALILRISGDNVALARQDRCSLPGCIRLGDADLHGRVRDPVPLTRSSTGAGFATRRTARTGAAQHTCATCLSFLACKPKQILGGCPLHRPPGDVGEGRLCRLSNRRQGVHATASSRIVTCSKSMISRRARAVRQAAPLDTRHSAIIPERQVSWTHG
jgi:hypothetical protein